jgi:hypothetical protein
VNAHVLYNGWELEGPNGNWVDLAPSSAPRDDGSDWWSVTVGAAPRVPPWFLDRPCTVVGPHMQRWLPLAVYKWRAFAEGVASRFLPSTLIGVGSSRSISAISP